VPRQQIWVNEQCGIRAPPSPCAGSLLAHKARVLQNLIDLLKAEEEGMVTRQRQVRAPSASNLALT